MPVNKNAAITNVFTANQIGKRRTKKNLLCSINGVETLNNIWDAHAWNASAFNVFRKRKTTLERVIEVYFGGAAGVFSAYICAIWQYNIKLVQEVLCPEP
jgi:hypothetical protein